MTTIVTRITGATAKNAPLTSLELDTNFINLNNDKLESSWTGNTNLVTLGTIATGTWNATTIATNKGGTGLTAFTSGGALYATSTSALTSGTLPVSAGGTGVTASTGSGSNVLSTSPILVTPTLGVASATSLTTTGDITVGGNLVVSGTTTTVNSTTITVADKNIELGKVATPTNTTADGGGITLKGATDKTFNWVNATGAWTSSEHIALAAGKDIFLSGATSGTLTLAVADIAGTNTITFPAATGNVVTTGDTGTVTNTMLAGSIATSKITGLAASATTDATNAANITSGTLPNARLSAIPNASLANSSVTVGTTAIALGASSTTLAGLTSVTSTAFVGALTGNASTATSATTATTLATSRNINGVAFNGSADITVTAAAGTLTGTTLNSTVVSSSLTSVGTLTTGTWSATNIALNKGGTNAALTAVNGGVVYSSASAMAITSAGTAGQFLKSNGAGAPTWSNIGPTSGIFWENEQVVTTNYTITAGRNAGTFGPISINDGVTVTIPDGSTWTII